jgi:HD-GYP domain-containing protein (c-di-GMP phosphodiesterase class II)
MVADVAEALSAERPYRLALERDEVLRVMTREAGGALDANVFAALEGLWSERPVQASCVAASLG